MSLSTLSEWASFYHQHPQQPDDTYQQLCANFAHDDNAWIYIATDSEIHAQLTLIFQAINSGEKQTADFPLLGVPFAVKDNIDVAGMPTSAACPAAHRRCYRYLSP